MNERQLLLKKVKSEIESNEREDVFSFYNLAVCRYNGIESYLKQISNVRDKIIVAEWAYDYDTLSNLMSDVELTDYERNKYQKLLTRNRDLDKTINFDLLMEKYSFLDPIMDIITTDINIQQRIVSLSDERLELFKVLFEHLLKATNYPIPYISRLLEKISYSPFSDNKEHCYEELTKELEQLIKDGYELSNDDLEKYLYLCNSKYRNLPVDSIWDLRDLNKKMMELWKKENIDPQRNNPNPSIKDIKASILFITYGIPIFLAEDIARMDFSNIEITDENRNAFEIYQSISRIIMENDAEVLISIFDEYCAQEEIDFDYMRGTLLEEELKKVFAREITNSTFKTAGEPIEMIDDIPVYDAGVDFKMVVTALGAYQADFDNKENYSEYWNSSIIQTHTNSCSLIANNNLSMATIKNVIFGFSSMDDAMLMDSSYRDIGSSDDSKDLYYDFGKTHYFMSPEDLIDNTRSDYNELVYERRDLGKNAEHFKKNPDYIVFIEEYEDIENWIEHYKDNEWAFNILNHQKKEQKDRWKETIRAAKDFGIPIVKINREKCARNEINKIQMYLNDFRNTLNPELIEKIIVQYENNSVGLCSPHDALKNRYFPDKRMIYILDEIEKTISSADDSLKQTLLQSYKEALEEEQNKVDRLWGHYRNNKQTSGINYKQRFAFIEQMINQRNISQDFEKKEEFIQEHESAWKRI